VGSIATTGSTIVTAKTGRFRRRIAFGVIFLVLLLVGGGIALTGALTGSGAKSPAVAAAASASLPSLGPAKPVLAALSATAPTPDPAVLSSALAPLLSAPALGSGLTASVLDVRTGTVLLDRNAAAPAAPASTAKLLTSAAVLTTVGPTATIATKVVAGATPGEVVLVGGGDPTLSRTTPSKSYPGAATMADLAAQVRAVVPPATPITRILVDNSLYSGPLTAPGWAPGDAPSTYAAPVTATSVDGARTSPGSLGRSGAPGTDAGRALADALGVRAAVGLGQAPPGAKTLATVHSASIERLVEQALAMSDNMLAEALARQVAIARHLPASFDGSAKAVTDALTQAGMDVSGVTLVDGSGLSRQDRVPAAVLARVVRASADGTLGNAADLLSGLPVAGYDGTLADRGDSDPKTSPGTVRAKTGTLLGVHALAGTVVDVDGRLLAFALLGNDVPGSESAAEGALDNVATALARCGCR
jgi:D-alanyl-D-alanine carboxypeptidase/D-alanyl-D-alanine-endopeptidase (penicillin-binding protein 4)